MAQPLDFQAGVHPHGREQSGEFAGCGVNRQGKRGYSASRAAGGDDAGEVVAGLEGRKQGDDRSQAMRPNEEGELRIARCDAGPDRGEIVGEQREALDVGAGAGRAAVAPLVVCKAREARCGEVSNWPLVAAGVFGEAVQHDEARTRRGRHVLDSTEGRVEERHVWQSEGEGTGGGDEEHGPGLCLSRQPRV